MRKILLLTDDMQQGGAERQLAYLAKEFKLKGFDVRLVKFYHGKNFYNIDLEAVNIKTEEYLRGRSPIIRPFIIASIVKSWKPDLVITYKDGTSVAASLAKLLIKFRLAVSERNTTQKLSFRERIKFHVYKLADYVVPNSFSQADFIKQHAPWLLHKLKVITNMVDLDRFNSNSQHLEKPLKTIITTARITPQKNVLRYLEAVKLVKEANLSNIHFDWYGRAEDAEYYEEVQRKVKELCVAEMITFHSHCTEVESLYKESSLFCLPSIYEGFSNVICEAMATGLPIVCSNVCDNPYIVENGINGLLFNPNDPNDIADKIISMLKLTNTQRKNIVNNNITKVHQLCSANAFILKYQSLLN